MLFVLSIYCSSAALKRIIMYFTDEEQSLINLPKVLWPVGDEAGFEKFS